jgi:hypothetical protein
LTGEVHASKAKMVLIIKYKNFVTNQLLAWPVRRQTHNLHFTNKAIVYVRFVEQSFILEQELRAIRER